MPILRGVWQRITSFGVLRPWGQFWAVLWLFVGLWTLTYHGFVALLVPLGGWFLGHAVLAALTQWDDRFDDMALAQQQRNYKDRYDAA